ncbi:hypothetical protein AAFF_G00226890 [Aldrovandia affinis]|uniref:Uncharacterized protein n=1 Tax=Aldrovandia affinis TaxID=143900 RepID=A0AAD7TCW1_9TELE|nr:hypothetical protein AAFF_G00226890 [Aldrovandia affinis]
MSSETGKLTGLRHGLCRSRLVRRRVTELRSLCWHKPKARPWPEPQLHYLRLSATDPLLPESRPGEVRTVALQVRPERSHGRQGVTEQCTSGSARAQTLQERSEQVKPIPD